MPEPLRVLIVEDEALLLMQLEAIVEAEGHDVVGTAMTSGEAITLARMVAPDLAFVDLHLLDGPTGPDIARFLCGSGKTLVVFVTANASRLPRDYAGAAGIVSKPFSQAGIAAALRFLAGCVGSAPSRLAPPAELTLSDAFARQIAGTA